MDRSEATSLRHAAEEQLKTKNTDAGIVRTAVVSEGLLHELQVHQIELERQNDLLRQSRDDLEMAVENLSVRSSELEAANVELEAFNFCVSHDLRSPLTAINSYCQVVQELSKDKFNDEIKGYLSEIHKGTMRMDKLIDTLLDFSRIKHVKMSHESFDFSAMAKVVAAELAQAEPDRKIKFLIAEGIIGNGDAVLWRIALDNLMGNAWKYTSKQEFAEIEFGMTEAAGKPAFFIRDNGPGFDMVYADSIFSPFQRLPETNIEGNGIGLATVDRIVKRHGGKVWAVSEPGKGAVFLFTFE